MWARSGLILIIAIEKTWFAKNMPSQYSLLSYNYLITAIIITIIYNGEFSTRATNWSNFFNHYLIRQKREINVSKEKLGKFFWSKASATKSLTRSPSTVTQPIGQFFAIVPWILLIPIKKKTFTAERKPADWWSTILNSCWHTNQDMGESLT